MREKQRNAHFPRAAMETTTARLENSRTDYQVVMVHTHTHESFIQLAGNIFGHYAITPLILDAPKRGIHSKCLAGELLS